MTPNTIELDGREYAIDLEEYSAGPQDTFRDSVTSSDQATDTLYNTHGAWMRYQTSWHHGADQEIRDFLDDSDPYRFDQSHGFNPWSKLGLDLCGSVHYDDDTDITGTTQMIVSNTYLFVATGSNLMRFATQPDGFDTPSTSGTINDLATDGYDLYVASSTGLQKFAASGLTGADFSTDVTGNVTKVAFVANRLIIAKANVLSEVASSGVLTTILTHYQAGFNWTTIFAVGSRIYAGGYVGAKSELFTFTTTEAGALVRGPEAAPFPAGEQLLCGVSAAGAVLLGTSKGVRFAQLGADGTLTYGAIIDAPGRVSSLTVDGRFAWGTWNDASTALDGNVGSFRMDLSTFVDVLQPAYAADVVVPPANEVFAVERFNGYTVLATDYAFLAYASEDDYIDDDVFVLVNSAKITSGRLYFGTVEPKGLVELHVQMRELEEFQTLIARVYDHNDELLATKTVTEGATELTMDLDGQAVLWCTVELEYDKTFGTSGGPFRLYSWRLRAFPTPPQTLQWILPILTYQTVAVGEGEGADRSQGERDIVDELEQLHATKELVTLRIGDRQYQVRVENFVEQADNWSDNGKCPVGICKVQLVSA